MSIYVKDGLEKQGLIELLEYSLSPECQFLTRVKKADINNEEDVFQDESVIRFLKIEEKVHASINFFGKRTYSFRFSVKVLVEDMYWTKAVNPKNDETHYKSGKVPAEIHNRVSEILNRE